VFNKEELEYLYGAVNMMPPPNSTQGGKAKAYMINKLCDLIDELEKSSAAAAGDTADADLA
jgi:hypothetical protein